MTTAQPNSTQVGHFRITSILDGGITVPAHELWAFGAERNRFTDRTARPREQWKGFTEEEWAAQPDSVNSKGELRMDIGGRLITGGGDRIIMIDVGLGPVESFFKGGELMSNLSAAGCDPGDVTDIVFTHLHEDHIGWVFRDGKRHFPNATLYCNRKDWEYFSRPDPLTARAANGHMEMEILEPVRRYLELWDEDFVLTPGCSVVAVPGHTPGSAMVSLESNGSKALLIGDAAHSPAELLDPKWAGIGDIDPDCASLTRQNIVAEYVDDATLIGAAHFPGLRLGRIDRSGINPRFIYA